MPVLLNELLEPPPSAALLPRITPDHVSAVTEAGVGKGTPRSALERRPSRARRKDEDSTGNQKPAEVTNSVDVESGKAERPIDGHERKIPQSDKRVYTRERKDWTEEETQQLLKGVAIYGKGKWKKILGNGGLTFNPHRTAVDLKDRYRTCRMNEQRQLERQASRDAASEKQQPSKDKGPSKNPILKEKPEDAQSTKIPEIMNTCETSPDLTAVNNSSIPFKVIAPDKGDKKSGAAELVGKPSKDKLFNDECPSHQKTQDKPAIQELSESSFAISMPKTFDRPNKTVVREASSDLAKKTHPPRSWTEAEDKALSRGYRKYGFAWTAIAKDTSLGLSHRTGPQVRDRFRIKFPAHYQDSVPLPLPEPSRRLSRDLSQQQNQQEADAVADDNGLVDPMQAKESSEPPFMTIVLEDGKQPYPSESRSKSRSIFGPTMPREYRSPYAPMELTNLKATSKSIRLRPSSSAPLLSTRPAPSTERHLDIMALLNGDVPSPVDADAVDAGFGRALDITGLLNDDSDDLPPEPGNDAVRHLDIMGLLNDNTAINSSSIGGALAVTTGNAEGGAGAGPLTVGEGQGARLPPMKNTLDDWGAVRDSVTLPPLLWEDMASRPIFDLD